MKRRRTEDDSALALARAKELRKDHIRRARVLADPLLGGSLRQELGLVISPTSLTGVYCQGWHSSEVLHSEAYNPNRHAGSAPPGDLSPVTSYYTPMFFEEPVAGQSINSSTVAMGGFDFNPQSNSLFACMCLLQSQSQPYFICVTGNVLCAFQLERFYWTNERFSTQRRSSF